MRRILAEVLETKQLANRTNDSDMPWRKVRCRVKLLSAVPESHHLPDDIKDSTCTIERPILFDGEYKPGSKIVLSPSECELLVRRMPDEPSIGSMRKRVTTYRTDVNADGFTERVMENAFLRVVIGPRFGARIWQILNKRTGCNMLHDTYDFSKECMELGGQEDHIVEQGREGDFWNAKFEEKDVKCDNHGCRVVYECKSEKTKGLTFVKEITLPPDAPIVHYYCSFKYSGAEKPPEDGKADEYEMSLWTRVGLSVPEKFENDFLYIIPTKEKLHKLRRQVGWRNTHAFGMSAPYMLAQNEENGSTVALLLDPDMVKFGCVYTAGREYSCLEPRLKTVKVAKDGEQNFGFALVVGDAIRADQDGLALTTTGPADGSRTPFFALTTTQSAQKKLDSDELDTKLAIKKTEYAGIPKIGHGTAWLSADQSNKFKHDVVLNSIKPNGGAK